MRSTVVALLTAASAVACGPRSQIDAKASVMLSGSVQLESGGAAPMTRVKLIRHPDALQAISQAFVALGSVGLACISGQLDICSSFEESNAGTDGGYSVALRGADTQGSVGQALTFTNFAGCLNGNCAVASDFQIQRTPLTLPPLRFWTEVGAVADANGDSLVSWPALEASLGGAAADDYSVSIVAADGGVWWQQDARGATMTTIDRRVTQDRDAEWSVLASRKQ
jgi:hypothetical protein